jgi:hypothetical protein
MHTLLLLKQQKSISASWFEYRQICVTGFAVAIVGRKMSSNYRPDRHSSAQPFFGSASSSSSPYSSYEPSAPPESGNPNFYPSRNEQVGGGGAAAAATAASYVWNNPHLSSAGYCGQQVPQTTGFSGPQSGNPYVQTPPTASSGGAGIYVAWIYLLWVRVHVGGFGDRLHQLWGFFVGNISGPLVGNKLKVLNMWAPEVPEF